jgi:HSP20 family protein
MRFLEIFLNFFNPILARKANDKSSEAHLLVEVMPKKKKTAEEEAKKTEVAVKTTKAPTSIKPREKKTAVTPAAPLNVWRAFDDAFERVRSDFADILFPSYWEMPALLPETRVPAVDLEDREKDYLLKAEMPGFKKEDIEIEVQENSLEITGTAGWKYDKKEQAYICKERACESFYRAVELPEEIKTDEVAANLSDGVLEITLPKKAPKPRRKVAVK